jgi:hypothetical protein
VAGLIVNGMGGKPMAPMGGNPIAAENCAMPGGAGGGGGSICP